jgi:DNA-binding NarL/FixJ family response regulator
VRTAITGQIFLSRPLTERAIQAYIKQEPAQLSDEFHALTPREREILHLAVEGLTSSEIARQLSISKRTVETHRANLMHKLGVHSQSGLVAYARKQKIIP